MNLQEYITSNDGLMALIGSLQSPHLIEVALKSFCANAILTQFEPGQVITDEQLMILAEDLEVPVPKDRLFALVSGTGILEEVTQGQYRVKEKVSLNSLFPSELRSLSVEVPISELAEVSGWKPRDEHSAPRFVRPDECAAVLDRTWNWTLEIIAYCLDHGIRGVPVFWPCSEEGHRPLITSAGTATTMDTLHLLVQPARFGIAIPELESAESVERMLSFLDLVLSLQKKGDSWVDGAFSVEGQDEDFVGSYLKEYADRGPCPTVDATADAVLALCLTLNSSFAHDERMRKLTYPIEMAIKRAIAFLLRMQFPNGAWGVYRYEHDVHYLDPREPSSALAVDALAASFDHYTADAELQAQLEQAIDSYVGLVTQYVHRENGEVFWVPNYSSHGSSLSDNFYATVWVAHSLLVIIASWPKRKSTLGPLLKDAISFLADHWTPNRDTYMKVVFMVPTWEGPADIEFPWELPADAIVASLLLEYSTDLGEALADPTWQKIYQTLVDSLSGEIHGHWVDYLMKKEGEDRAIPGNTRYHVEMIMSYLRHLRTSLDKIISGLSQENQPLTARARS